MTLPDLDDVTRAAARIAPHAHRTPVITSATLDAAVGARVLLKCENLQKVGAFKFRGACNAVLALDAGQARRGVATHSSGNHAQALALAARLRGIEAQIVMPTDTRPVKLEAVRGYGGVVVPCAPTLEARERTAAQLVERTGATLIHPYDDARIIAGQGTAALELLEQAGGQLDLLLAPVGGGGLMAGTLVAVASRSPATRVIGVEPAGADDALRSLRAGRIIPSMDPDTIAEGLLTSLGELNFAIIRRHIHDIVTVDDDAIVRALRFVWERIKTVIEPSAALAVAALLDRVVEAPGATIGVILSGGNVDLDSLPF